MFSIYVLLLLKVSWILHDSSLNLDFWLKGHSHGHLPFLPSHVPAELRFKVQVDLLREISMQRNHEDLCPPRITKKILHKHISTVKTEFPLTFYIYNLHNHPPCPTTPPVTCANRTTSLSSFARQNCSIAPCYPQHHRRVHYRDDVVPPASADTTNCQKKKLCLEKKLLKC